MTTWPRHPLLVALLSVAPSAEVGPVAVPPSAPAPTMAEVLAASPPTDWRRLDPENTLYLELAGGRVVIDLAPGFAPNHVANVKTLARAKYFDGLTINRVQDNYVVQWGDADAEDPAKARPLADAKASLAAEFDRPASDDLPFWRLPEADAYAPEIGFASGFPAARDARTGRAWLAHCYGMVGAGRGNAPESNGSELYVVIGHAPRHLDRNVTLVGRVVQGMDRLSILPRGTGAMGFYEEPEQRVRIRSVRVAADLPEAERADLEILRTDTKSFQSLVESRRNRREDWFIYPVGRIELCNVPIPVRVRAAAANRPTAATAPN